MGHADSRSPQQQPPQKTQAQKTPEPDNFISVKTVLVEDPCPNPEPKPVEIEIKHKLKRQVSRELPDPVVSNDNVVPLREKSFSGEFSSPRPGGGGGFFTSMIERESRENRFEVNDGGFATSEYSCSGPDHDSDASSVISEAETVKSYNNNNNSSSSVEAVKSFSNRSRTASGFDVSKHDLGGGYFENLVNILQEAVKDISR